MLQITLTANAGILLRTERVSFLVDALHAEGIYPFSKVPQEQLQSMNAGNNVFRNVNYLVFTHSHPDHYSPGVVLEYLKHNRVKRIILPEAETMEDYDRERMLLQWIKDSNLPAWRFHQERNALHSYMLEPDVFLTAMCMPHLSERFADRNCICLLISIGNRNVLFTSDCDFQEKELFRFANHVHIDAVFLNPYFFHADIGREILSETVCAQHIFIYHVPFAHEDILSMRALVRQDVRKYTSMFADVQVLQECGQSFMIS